MYATGLLVFALTYVGLGLTRSAVWVWLLFAIFGAYWALTDGVGRAWIADLLPAELAGTGLGLYQGVIGVCVLLAGAWAGLAWDGNGRIPLIVSGSITGALALGLLAAGKTLGPQDEHLELADVLAGHSRPTGGEPGRLEPGGALMTAPHPGTLASAKRPG